jgi:hypothetical protein
MNGTTVGSNTIGQNDFIACLLGWSKAEHIFSESLNKQPNKTVFIQIEHIKNNKPLTSSTYPYQSSTVQTNSVCA